MNTWWLGHLQDNNDVNNIVNDLTLASLLRIIQAHAGLMNHRLN